MGYDMYVRGINSDADHGYLRRNIFGMPFFREMLIEVGACFAEYDFESAWTGRKGPYPSFPEDGDPDYDAKLERTLSWRPEHPGIPVHKLCDNSGWIVTADECREALDAIHAHREKYGALPRNPEHPDWDCWKDTLPFLESAAKHEGFEVF